MAMIHQHCNIARLSRAHLPLARNLRGAEHRNTPWDGIPWAPRKPCRRSRHTMAASSTDPASSQDAAASTTAVAAAAPKSAREAVELGQQVFDRKRYAEALQLFRAAMELQPNEDEARAALYNGACANARLKNWQAATDDVVRAVNEYSLKLEVAAKDPDLAALRERREWQDALEVAKGGVSTAALVGARAEARAPFRLVRLFLFGGLGAGAAVGLVIITGRLIAALRGGEGAPELSESLINFSVNAAALALFSWLFSRDVAASQRDSRAVEREEALGRLLVQLGPDRVVPLARFRGAARPVVLAGSQGYINRALKAAELHQTELRARGISVVTLPLSSADPAEKLSALKREFRGKDEKGTKGFGAPVPGKAQPSGSKGDSRWQLQPAATEEWESWLKGQKEFAGVKGDDVFVQIQLDGSVQRSGIGVPPWDRWLDDIPELDSLRTRLTDGARASR